MSGATDAFPLAEYIDDDTQSYYDIFNTDFDFTKSYDCTTYTVPATGVVFLPNLSYMFYGTTKLWWVIASMNGIINSLEEIPGGTVLVIPDKGQVFAELTNMQNKRALNTSGTVII